MRYIKRGSLTPHPMTFGVQPALWLDTSDINERILNSGNVSSGLDKSSYNEDYDQPTAANQPFLNVGAQNGLDTWRGDGINDYLINSAGVSLGTNNTLFFYIKLPVRIRAKTYSSSTAKSSKLIATFI